MGERLVQTLADFGVDATVVGEVSGPRVTRRRPSVASSAYTVLALRTRVNAISPVRGFGSDAAAGKQHVRRGALSDLRRKGERQRMLGH